MAEIDRGVMPSMKDFLLPDGKTDWKSYDEAQRKFKEYRRSIGYYCRECWDLAEFFNPPGYPTQCKDCRALDDPGEVLYNNKIRCPKCGKKYTDEQLDDSYRIRWDGEHEVNCHNCGYGFLITTTVEITYSSPARLEDKHEESDITIPTEANKGTD